MSTFSFPVEASHVLMFARAVGDESPQYRIPEPGEERDVLASPTFLQSCVQYDDSWPLRPKNGQPWFGAANQATSEPADDDRAGSLQSSNLLHAEQVFEYHRSPMVGDILTAVTAPGRQWRKEGRRGGTLDFREDVTEYRDQKGELVVTARSVCVLTTAVVSSEGQA